MSAYDDGGPGVPGGLDGPIERVVVLGAGIAGLTTANALTHAGVECVVLEARDRVGGRLHTIELGGGPVDLGGSWLHHPDGNPLRRFAEEVGVECRSGDPLPDLTGFDLAAGRRLTPAELEATMSSDAGFAASLGDLRTRLGPSASAAEGIRAYLAGGLAGDDRRRVGQALLASVEADSAGAAGGVALDWLWTQDEYAGSYFGDLPVGGYGRVVAAMAAGLDVRLGWVAAGVRYDGAGVVVTSTGGATERGSHLVVAVPLGVLKDGRPAFDPPLPDGHRDACRRLGFGRYRKILLSFDEPFWRREGWSHLALYHRDPDRPATWVFDLSALGGGPTLAFHVFHSLVGPATSDAGWAMDQLSAVLGRACPPPTDVHVTSWTDDRHTRGAYTHVPVGATNADLDLLGTPVAGRVGFAGEHTSSARMGYADGAMSSGIREAKRLLGATQVTLGRLERSPQGS